MPTTQTALLIMAHGSRASAANEEFLAFVNKLAEQNQHYTAVRGVFLELSEPSLVQAVHSLADQGINTFQLYPLFFNCGKHVQKDIPAQIAEAQASRPNIEIRMLDYFGSSKTLVDAVNQHILQQTENR